MDTSRVAGPWSVPSFPEEKAEAPLAAITITQELLRRATHETRYEAETRAFAALAQALADRPETILQTLAETVVEILGAGSAGLSLLDGSEQQFVWSAIAGEWNPHLGGGTPRNFGPCGDVLDCNAPILFSHWERRYPYLAAATPLAEEGLLVPFQVAGKTVGTVWAIHHDPGRNFNNEDLRLLTSLSRFAAAGYQVTEALKREERHRVTEARAVEALKDSERQLRLFMNSVTNYALCMLDRKGFM
jgi:GAF domain-containing protein